MRWVDSSGIMTSTRRAFACSLTLFQALIFLISTTTLKCIWLCRQPSSARPWRHWAVPYRHAQSGGKSSHGPVPASACATLCGRARASVLVAPPRSIDVACVCARQCCLIVAASPRIDYAQLGRTVLYFLLYLGILFLQKDSHTLYKARAPS